jgi:hypothetical protein
MMGALDKLQAEVDKLRKELSKRASDGTSGMVRPPPRNVPPPKEFDRKRDAMEFEDFLWRIEKYFKATHMEDEEDKIETATSYLTGNAAIWWRRRHADIESGLVRIDSWADLKGELKVKFYPSNVADEAREKLRELKHKGSISEYVKEFTNLVLQIPTLSDDDQRCYFIHGLQEWARVEVNRRHVKTLD